MTLKKRKIGYILNNKSRKKIIKSFDFIPIRPSNSPKSNFNSNSPKLNSNSNSPKSPPSKLKFRTKTIIRRDILGSQGMSFPKLDLGKGTKRRRRRMLRSKKRKKKKSRNRRNKRKRKKTR